MRPARRWVPSCGFAVVWVCVVHNPAARYALILGGGARLTLGAQRLEKLYASTLS